MSVDTQEQPDYVYDETKDLRKKYKAKYASLLGVPVNQQTQQTQQNATNHQQLLNFLNQIHQNNANADNIRKEAKEEIQQEQIEEKHMMDEMNKDLLSNKSVDKEKIKKIVSGLM